MDLRVTLSLGLAVSLLVGPAALMASPAASGLPVVKGEAQDRKPVEVLVFQFEDEEGQLADFQVAVGGFVNVTHADRDLHYRLLASKDRSGRAEVRVVQFADSSREKELGQESLVLDADGLRLGSSIAPFRIGFKGTKTQLAKMVDRMSEAIACCISCGGWTVCCGVAVNEPGWVACCSVEMCGWGCAVCEALLEQ